MILPSHCLLRGSYLPTELDSSCFCQIVGERTVYFLWYQSLFKLFLRSEMSFLLHLFLWNPFHHSSSVAMFCLRKPSPILLSFSRVPWHALSFRTPPTFALSLDVSADPVLPWAYFLSICLSSQQTNCKQSTGRAMSSLHSQGLAWSLDGGHGSGDAEKGAGVRTGVTGTYMCVHAWCLSRGHLLLTLSWKTLKKL